MGSKESNWDQVAVVLSGQDEPWIPWSELKKARRSQARSYESLFLEPEQTPPERAILLPYKIPLAGTPRGETVEDHGVLSGIGETLRWWLDEGCHVVFVVPNESRRVSRQGGPVLAARTGGVIGTVLNGFWAVVQWTAVG